MTLCRVIGTLVSTKKDRTLHPYKMLICHPIDLERKYTERNEILAIDTSNSAGVGDMVLVAMEGDAAQQVLQRTDMPVHSIVVCVVDDFHVDERFIDNHSSAG